MNANVGKSPAVLLFNPSVYIAGGRALVLGLAAILVTGLIGIVSQTHFDGVLDTHTGAAAPFWFFLSEGILDWLCLAVVLLIAGRIISRTPFRTIDVLGTQALARWPTIFIALATLAKGYQRFSRSILEQITKGKTPEFSGTDALLFVAVMAVMILCLVWMVALMYKSFSLSCNVKGGKAIGTFIGGLIVAEVLSKIAMYGLVISTIGAPQRDSSQAFRFQGIPGEWLVLSGERDQWDLTNNVVTGHSTTGDSILASASRYGDVTISAMLGTTNREASLALRLQDAANGYLAVFVPDETPGAGGVPRITLLKRKFGREEELAIFKKPGLSGPGKLEELTFMATGSQLEVRLNGDTVLRATDGTFSNGFVGLRVYGDIGMPCDGTFSNLTVRPGTTTTP